MAGFGLGPGADHRCVSLVGGTDEIQRNLIAERGLGLPRDPNRS